MKRQTPRTPPDNAIIAFLPQEWRWLYLDAKEGTINQNCDWSEVLIELLELIANLNMRKMSVPSSANRAEGGQG